MGLKQPEFKTNPLDYYWETIGKQDIWIIKYSKNDQNGRNLFLNIYETAYAPASGQLSGSVNEHPWDIVVITTTDWLLVARPEPQQDVQKANDQAKGIWKVALEELGKDSSLTIMICWVICPSDSVLVPNKALNLLGAYQRQFIYDANFVTGMKEATQLKRRLCVPQEYDSHKSVHEPDQELFKFESRIVIHDKDTLPGMGGPNVSELFPQNQYLDRGFPPISCNQTDTYTGHELDPIVYVWRGSLD